MLSLQSGIYTRIFSHIKHGPLAQTRSAELSMPCCIEKGLNDAHCPTISCTDEVDKSVLWDKVEPVDILICAGKSDPQLTQNNPLSATGSIQLEKSEATQESRNWLTPATPQPIKYHEQLSDSALGRSSELQSTKSPVSLPGWKQLLYSFCRKSLPFPKRFRNDNGFCRHSNVTIDYCWGNV